MEIHKKRTEQGAPGHDERTEFSGTGNGTLGHD